MSPLCLVLSFYLLSKAINSQVTNWNVGSTDLPNNDLWTAVGFDDTVNPNEVHVFGGQSNPTQHYSFNLKTMAVKFYKNISVHMHTHVQPISINNLTFVMNDHDAIFYAIDLVTFSVNALVSQPPTTRTRVCLAENGTHLFMVGGYKNSTGSGTVTLNVLNLKTKKWISGAPTMRQARFDFSCGVDPGNAELFAIGGQVTATTYTSEIEYISTTDIMNSKWQKFAYSLSSPMALYNNAIVPNVFNLANRRLMGSSDSDESVSDEDDVDRRRMQSGWWSAPTSHPVSTTYKPTHSPSYINLGGTPKPANHPPRRAYVMIITGGSDGQCCPPENSDCDYCSNTRKVFALNLTQPANPYRNPVTTVQSMDTGRAGARMIYYDCDVNGPTLWIFGGAATNKSDSGLRTFIYSNHIQSTARTCPVDNSPKFSSSSSERHREWWKSLGSSSSSSSSSSDGHGEWWKSLKSEDSSSDDNSYLHFWKTYKKNKN